MTQMSIKHTDIGREMRVKREMDRVWWEKEIRQGIGVRQNAMTTIARRFTRAALIQPSTPSVNAENEVQSSMADFRGFPTKIWCPI